MFQFEQYIEEFSNSINVTSFITNLLVATVLSFALKYFYVKFANSLSNRRRVADNFLLLTLTTMVIITIVKSSIALSLGLVGALSIVRFRSAIKNPEELTYLFLAIAIGLACGANQPLIAAMALVFILLILFINKKINGRDYFNRGGKMFLNISTDVNDVNKITSVVSAHCDYVEFKRLDNDKQMIHLTYLFKSGAMPQIESLSKALNELSEKTNYSIVDEPDLLT